jgi:hypothetical protein
MNKPLPAYQYDAPTLRTKKECIVATWNDIDDSLNNAEWKKPDKKGHTV